MNKKTTTTELKYQNKLKFNTIVDSYNLLVKQKNEIEKNVDILYSILQYYLLNGKNLDYETIKQQLDNVKQDALYENDILVGDYTEV